MHLARLSEEAERIRNSELPADAQARAILYACRSRASSFREVLAADALAASQLLEEIVIEQDRDLCHGFGFLLREDVAGVAERVQALTAGGQLERVRLAALAALGSPRDRRQFETIDAPLRADSSEAVRFQAAESLGARRANYERWDGIPVAAESLRQVIEKDISPTVRHEAARVLVLLCGQTREILDFLAQHKVEMSSRFGAVTAGAPSLLKSAREPSPTRPLSPLQKPNKDK